ncbi:MAG: HAMP domain-containing histidine kinase [Lachnospiraceae bacterium]|nr:HAMP domain-containing histidine kinase [Lachnospiraceae bacterium]
MTRVIHRKDSLYLQLLKLLIGSAAAAFLIFLALNYVGEYVIDNYYYNSDYVQRKDGEYAEKLQRYIDEAHLHSGNGDQLNSWVKKQKVISLRVYKDGMLVFDSKYPEREFGDENVAMAMYEWESYHTVSFSDGKAEISVFGMYAYQFYTYARTAELLLSFLLFLAFVILGIRAKMNYILLLSNEIEILEGGSLDYQVTVKGKDELGALAGGLNSMRLSLGALMEKEAQMVQENQRIVTEMSHDLRTPVTSIMLYTEILKKGKYKDEEQLKEYLNRIEQKACRMKQLTDHLFAHSLVAGESEIALEEPETFEILFYDLFSETCSYLEQKGFQVEFKVQWMEEKIRIYTNYVTRIMDNITSNIIKYADAEKAVLIRSSYGEGQAGFFFENAVGYVDEKTQSACVGIQSVKNMMAKMGGECKIWRGKEWFGIEILFPLWRV